MLLISLILAAAPPPVAKPDAAPGREAARSRPAPAARSRRLIDLEAAVDSLAPAEPDSVRPPGPEGL